MAITSLQFSPNATLLVYKSSIYVGLFGLVNSSRFSAQVRRVTPPGVPGKFGKIPLKRLTFANATYYHFFPRPLFSPLWQGPILAVTPDVRAVLRGCFCVAFNIGWELMIRPGVS